MNKTLNPEEQKQCRLYCKRKNFCSQISGPKIHLESALAELRDKNCSVHAQSLLSQIQIQTSLSNLLKSQGASKGLQWSIRIWHHENHEGAAVFTPKVRDTNPHCQHRRRSRVGWNLPLSCFGFLEYPATWHDKH